MSNVYTLRIGTGGVGRAKNDADPLRDMPGFELRLNVGRVVVPIAKEDGANRWTTDAKTVVRLPAWTWWAGAVPVVLVALDLGLIWGIWVPLVLTWWLPLAPWPMIAWRYGDLASYAGFKTAGFGHDWPWKRADEAGYFLTPSARIASASKEDARGEG